MSEKLEPTTFDFHFFVHFFQGVDVREISMLSPHVRIWSEGELSKAEYIEESPELERSGSTGGSTKSRRSNLLTQMCRTTGARESYCKVSAA